MSPKGILSHSQNPSGPRVNAVRGMASCSNSTCQYLDFKSNVENHIAPCTQSKVSSILGNAYPSLTVHVFNLHRSMQSLGPILLPHKDHCTGPWTETLSDSTHLHHLLEVLFHLLKKVGWNPPLYLLEWLGIC